MEQQLHTLFQKQTNSAVSMEQPSLISLLEIMASKKWDNFQRQSLNSKHNNIKNLGIDGGVPHSKKDQRNQYEPTPRRGKKLDQFRSQQDQTSPSNKKHKDASEQEN